MRRWARTKSLALLLLSATKKLKIRKYIEENYGCKIGNYY